MSIHHIIRRLLNVPNWYYLMLAGLVLGASFVTLTPKHNDFQIYYEAAHSVQQTGNPYTQAPAYIYPPLLAYLIQPIAVLPPFTAQRLWFAINTALLGVLLAISLKQCAAPAIQARWGLVVFAVVLAPPTILCLQLGQLGIVMAVLLIAIYSMRQRTMAVSFVFAVACLLKLYPALLGVFFLRRRSWSVLVGGSMAAFGIVLVHIALAGSEPYQRYLSNPFPRSAFPAEAEFNISLYGFWFRLLTTNAYAISVMHFPFLAILLTCLTSVAIVGIGLWLTMHAQAVDEALIFSLWLTVICLVAPINGYYNLSLMLVPVLALLRHLRKRPSPRLSQALLVATLLLMIPPNWNTSVEWLYTSVHSGWGVLVLTPSLYGMLIYYSILVVVIHRMRNTRDQRSEASSSIMESNKVRAIAYSSPNAE